MAGLNSLPEELLDKILRCLRVGPVDTKAMATLSLVSRKFHRIVEPHLYHNITASCFHSDHGHTQGNIHDLTQTLSQDPYLAGLVRVLKARRDKEPQKNDVLDKIRAQPDRTIRAWSLARQYSTWEAAAVLSQSLLDVFTPLLPKLTTLDLTEYRWAQDQSCMIGFVADLPRRHPQLKQLGLRLKATHSVLALSQAFAHPTIERLSLQRGQFISFAQYWNHWGQQNSKVKHLQLGAARGSHNISHVALLQDACPALEDLTLCVSRGDHMLADVISILTAFKGALGRSTVRRVEIWSYLGDRYMAIAAFKNPHNTMSFRKVWRKWSCMTWSLKGTEGHQDDPNMGAILHLDLPDLPGNSGERFTLHRNLQVCATILRFMKTPVQFALFLRGVLEQTHVTQIREAFERKNVKFGYRKLRFAFFK